VTESKDSGATRRLNAISDFHKTRWLYQQDDRDVGPFSPIEIQDLIRQGTITIRTRVRRAARQQWVELGIIDHFAAYIHELAKERRRAERERQYDQEENKVRSVRNRPKLLGTIAVVTALLVSGWYGWTLWQNSNRGAATGYVNALMRNLNLIEISAHGYLNTSGEIQWPSEMVPERKIRARRLAKRGRHDVSPIKRNGNADDLAAAKGGGVTEFAFGTASATGRELELLDINRVRSETVPKLIRCAQSEADRNRAFPGTTVRYSIQPNGRLGRLSVGKNGKRSRAFMSCVKGVIRASRVEPFDGSGRTITVPLKVGN
jgi:hypothetical protein